ncbi:MAG: tetratricopeptide repeat protein [Pseudomonadota bacterium]
MFILPGVFERVKWIVLRTLTVQALSACLYSACVQAATIKSHVKSVDELEYGAVLFDYFQDDFFSALVEHEYNAALDNPIAQGSTGQVLKGGMMLSYGMPDEAQSLFAKLLNNTTSPEVSNRAWYYLGKIYYKKSELTEANKALDKVVGEVPPSIYFDYFYLATLIGNKKATQVINPSVQNSLSGYMPGYPYFLFNIAIGHLAAGDYQRAQVYLQKVATYVDHSEELSVLSDRAKNGLAQIAIEQGQWQTAWTHLSGIRTNGLYSNRALLAYAWSAIKMKRFDDAIPALRILNNRSIALPEVQETKVLLSHLYEQQGFPQRALQSNIEAEQEYKSGMKNVAEAREIINQLDVPREFIRNIQALKSQSNWFSMQPSLAYEKLTPFLIDLMASNAFSEVLKELGELYTMQDNLRYWIKRSDQHFVILDNAAQKNFNSELKNVLQKSNELHKIFAEQKKQLAQHSLSLAAKDQDRITALLETTRQQLTLLADKTQELNSLESAYKQPDYYQPMVRDHHRRLQAQLLKTTAYIARLEPVMRQMVNAELDKHEQRMHYYWAQSRLAKARLYDANLLSLEQQPVANDKRIEAGKEAQVQ